MPGVMGGANGMLGPVGGNMAQMMASMMGGSSGGGGDGGGGHANGMPGPMGGNMAQVMASMMSGGGGGMDPAMLHGFMEAQRQRLAQSPIARQVSSEAHSMWICVRGSDDWSMHRRSFSGAIRVLNPAGCLPRGPMPSARMARWVCEAVARMCRRWRTRA